MKLTYPLLLNAKPKARRYKLSDRDSLYLLVSITGTKTWRFDYRLDGKPARILLGASPICRFTMHEKYEAMQPSWWEPESTLGCMKDNC